MTNSTSQSSFIQALQRIDPTEGLVQYTLATKPYHTKILDVLVEYVYAEDLNVTFTEDLSWVMTFSRPDVETAYSCGYGFVWDPLLTSFMPDNPLAPLTIVEATDAIDSPLPGSENSNSFQIQPATYTPFVVAGVSTNNNQLVFSKNYDVTGVNLGLNQWEISDADNTLVTELTTGNAPKVIFISSDTGPVGNGRYTVSGTPTWAAGTTTVTVVEAIPVQANGDGVLHRPLDNTINFPILAVTTGVGGTWTVAGDFTSLFQAGKTFEVENNTGTVDPGYTVASSVFGGTNTVITVVGTINALAAADGDISIISGTLGGELPAWPASQAVTFSIVSGTLPSPIVAATRYYFQPTPTPGYFNLADRRYPTEYHHYIDLASLGTGEFTIERDESFVPGAQISIQNTHYHRNDGTYIVKDVVQESPYERIYVYQKVEDPTPLAFIGNDGQISLDNLGYDQPTYCPPSQMSDLHADTFFHESLKFTFDIAFTEALMATYGENKARGFGETQYGDALLGSYGTYADSFDTRTAQTSGSPGADSAHTVLPTGIDTQLFDVGGFDETLQTVKHFYGRSV